MKTPYCLGMIRLNTFFKARIIQHFCPKYKKKVRYIKKERRKRTAFLIRSMELSQLLRTICILGLCVRVLVLSCLVKGFQ